MTALATRTETLDAVAARPGIRLGVDLSETSTIDQAIAAAGLDWGLDIVSGDQDFSVLTDNGVTTTSFPGQRLVQRTDNRVTLGVVGGRYTGVDNHAVMGGLGQPILDQGGVAVEGASLDHGRKVFMRFALPGTSVSLLSGQDLISFGITLKASHDGTGNVSAALEGTRLACTNGMTAKIKGIPHVFSVRHTASAEERMKEAQVILAGANRYAKEFAAVAEHMLSTRMTKTRFAKFIDGLYPKPEAEEGRSLTIWANRRAELLNLFSFAETNNLGRGTAWAAYNAVTEYTDWTSTVRPAQGVSVEAARARRQFEGANQDIKDKALAVLAA